MLRTSESIPRLYDLISSSDHFVPPPPPQARNAGTSASNFNFRPRPPLPTPLPLPMRRAAGGEAGMPPHAPARTRAQPAHGPAPLTADGVAHRRRRASPTLTLPRGAGRHVTPHRCLYSWTPSVAPLSPPPRRTAWRGVAPWPRHGARTNRLGRGAPGGGETRTAAECGSPTAHTTVRVRAPYRYRACTRQPRAARGCAPRAGSAVRCATDLSDSGVTRRRARHGAVSRPCRQASTGDTRGRARARAARAISSKQVIFSRKYEVFLSRPAHQLAVPAQPCGSTRAGRERHRPRAHTNNP